MELMPLARPDPSAGGNRSPAAPWGPASLSPRQSCDSRRDPASASCSPAARAPEMKGGGPPTACWQEEDIYSDLLFESLLGEKNHLISLHKQVLFYGTFV